MHSSGLHEYRIWHTHKHTYNAQSDLLIRLEIRIAFHALLTTEVQERIELFLILRGIATLRVISIGTILHKC